MRVVVVLVEVFKVPLLVPVVLAVVEQVDLVLVMEPAELQILAAVAVAAAIMLTA